MRLQRLEAVGRHAAAVVREDPIEGGGGKLLIDNREGKYASCAKAYNAEIEQHWEELGDILVFLHQDIAFDDDVWLRRIETELSATPNQLLGFAGMLKAGRTVSNLRYHRTKEYITRAQVAEKTEVESLDECCFAMTKEMYRKIRFDEKTCHHWHLYAVDFCYDARRRLGAKSYVLPETIYHKEEAGSGLSTDRHFLRSIWRMRCKYRKDYPMINTPCYIMSTQLLLCLMKMGKTMAKLMLGKG